MIVFNLGHGSNDSFTVAISCFSGFYPAIEACSLDWCCIDLEVNSTCKADFDQDDTEDVASESPQIQDLGVSESANNKKAERNFRCGKYNSFVKE